MAFYRINKGKEENLPSAMTEGSLYFCIDTGNLFVDHKNTSNTLVRTKVSGKYAEKLRYAKDGSTVEIDPSTILTDSNYETKIGTATQSKSGLISSTDKTKLDGVATGAEVNQNAFSNVVVGSTTVAADSKTDTLTLVAGSNVTITPDATNDKITIAAKDTTYSDATQSTHGLMSTTDKKKLDAIASGAEVNQNAFSNVTVGDTTVAADSKTDTLTLEAGSNVTITPDADNDKITIAAKDTTYSAATQSAPGLMSAADKKKLDGIASGAQVNTVTGVKGNSESSYRTGNVNITKANIGLGNVDNESKATMFTNAALTGTPTAPTANNDTNSTQIATTAFVQSAIDSKIAAADAMIYKGTIGTSGTITSLPATHKTGWTYKVITANTYAGKACEVGDMIICLTDGTKADDSHWTVVQSNIDGAVTGPASSVANRVAIFNGTTGKVIKDSGFTIASSVPANAKFTDTTYPDATQSAHGLMSTTDKTKLDGIATGAEVNQNAFSNVVVGSTTVAADSKTDTLTLVAGSNVTITPDANNDKITIAAKDTTYPDATQSAHGLMSTTDKTKLDGIATGAEVNQNAFSNVVVGSTTVAADSKTDTLTLVAGSNVTITPDANNDKITIAATDTTYRVFNGATSSAAGTKGLVPAPAAGKQTSFLRGDGTWVVPTNTDTKVNVTLGTTTKAYLLGTSTTPTSTATGVTAISDTGVYLDTTAGQLVATKFKGALVGNADTATKATKDSAGNQINTTYIKSLSVSGRTITYTKGNGSTGTITTQDTNTTYSVFNGATSSAAGTKGLVPAPAAGDQSSFLRGDGTWQVIESGSIVSGSTVAVGESAIITNPLSIAISDSAQIYQNGILLTKNTHYTINNDGNIALNGYTAENGDIFTVVSKSTGVDVSLNATAANIGLVNSAGYFDSVNNVESAIAKIGQKLNGGVVAGVRVNGTVATPDSNGVVDVASPTIKVNGNVVSADTNGVVNITNVVKTTGATMTGNLIAKASSTGNHVRNISVYASDATLPTSGNDGDIVLVYSNS